MAVLMGKWGSVMDKKLLTYSLLILVGTFISSVAQVLLKKSSQQHYDSVWKEYINLRVIIAYTVFFGASLLAVSAYKVVPLSLGAVLEATGYVYVTIFGVVIFRERLNWIKLIALALILTGVVVFSVAG